jgi:uncharacterized membrane protein
MRNYIAVVFSDKNKAYEALHGLWQLDDLGSITVHGTTVAHRDAFGQIQVDTKETHPALATAIGVGVGALLGLFAGPIGVAVGLAAGVGLGAAAGGIVGAVTDIGRAETRGLALSDTAFVLSVGQCAIIADVTEESSSDVDERMRALGGSVYRRAKSEVRGDAESSYDSYFYPYEYVPSNDEHEREERRR